MKVSELTAERLQAVAELHRQAHFDYQFPRDIETPLFPIRRAVLDDSGAIVGAAALKVEAEAYLWIDHAQGTPETRWKAIQVLQFDLALRAREIGFDQVHCALPPEIAKSFGPRLEDLGWKLARPWPIYTFSLR